MKLNFKIVYWLGLEGQFMISTNLKGLLWILMVSTSFTVFGQPSTTPIQQQNNSKALPLPPGTFRDLKPTQPLVLDTGSYTFIGLYFSPLLRRGAGGEALDARKVRSLTLINCTFEGKGKGTGVLSSGHLTVDHSSFTNMEEGIVQESPGGSHRKVTITSNRFTDNTTAISLNRSGSSGTATVDFTLKCNQFKLSCAEENVLLTDPDPCAATGTPQRRGLVIGEGVRLRAPNGTTFVPDQIGGQSVFNSNGVAYPNANEWPVRAGIDRTTLIPGTANIQNLPWRKPANWVSIDNNSSNPLVNYHRYFNEFVHNDDEEDDWNIETIFEIGKNVRMTASTGTNPGEFACQGFDIDDFDVFPLRVAVLPDSVNLLTGTRHLNMAAPWLGDAFPNPSSGEARIKAFIPKEAPFAVLQIVDLGTGKVLSGKVLEERGQLELILDCSKAASGTYGYQVLLGDKQLGMKKLTIVK